MHRVWKESLLSGTQRHPRTGETFTITPQDVRDAARNLEAMVKRGRNVPIIYEHLDVEEADPDEWKANYARHTIGRAGAARLSTLDDVRRGIASKPGTLLVRHDVDDLEDLKRLKKIGYVSPKIYRGYLDSRGEQYTGTTVAHIAASPTVVQWWQKPFSIQLSDETPVFIAYPAPAPKSRDGKSCPPHTRARRGVALSTTNPERPMADEKDDDKDMPEGGEGEGGKNAELGDLIDALRAHGMNIPDEVEDLKHLIIAVKANDAGTGAAEPDGDEADENPDDDMDAVGAASGADTTAPPGGAPMLMSVTDPEAKREIAKTLVAERRDVKARVDAALAARKLAGPAARRLHRVFTACNLSVTTTGDVYGKRWAKAVAELEAAEKGKPLASVELSATAAGPGAPSLLDPTKNTPERQADVQATFAGKMSLHDFNAKHK